MSLFRKSLASLGIGAARVDTVIQQDVLIPGDTLRVDVQVHGGQVEQQIDAISLVLCCHYMEEISILPDDSPLKKVNKICRLAEWSLSYPFMIAANEVRHFEAVLLLPYNSPITIGDSKVWLETQLDVPLAIDPADQERLTVRPDPLMDGVFTALELAGLRIRQVECEAASGFALPFVQEFEFVPVSGSYHGRWRELEIVAYRDESGLKLWFEVDRCQHGLTGMLSGLLSRGEIKRYCELPAGLHPRQAGEQVLAFLDSHT